MMNEMKKRELRVLFDVQYVDGKLYANGFYDALNHVNRLFKRKLSKEQYNSIKELLSMKTI